MKRTLISIALTAALAACSREATAPPPSTATVTPTATGEGAGPGAPPTVTTSSVTTEASSAPVPAGVLLPGTELAAGAQLPVREFKTLDGKSFKLDSLRGKAVMVNVWATWCVPCREEMPDLARLADSMKGKPFQLIGVSVDEADQLEKVQEFVTDLDIDYPIVLDPGSTLISAINAPVLPTTILLDAEGQATWLKMGQIRHDDPKVLAAIEQAMPKP